MPYPSDLSLRTSTLDLLGRIWTKLPNAIARARSWGADWCEVSTPFIHAIDGRVVAHVGVLEIPMIIAGRPQTVAGIHAVCADPDHRRQGHVRATMERALAWVDARHETALLWANDPAIYTRFGFLAREESIFVGPVRGGSTPSLRPLVLERPDDLALVRERLARRTPLSLQAGTREPGWLALLDLALWSPRPSLAYIPELECIIVYAVRGRFLDLYDVIAETIPPLAELAGRLGAGIDTAVVHASPDRLDAPRLVAEPTVLIDSLMVRGSWPLAGQPLAFSPITRC